MSLVSLSLTIVGWPWCKYLQTTISSHQRSVQYGAQPTPDSLSVCVKERENSGTNLEKIKYCS